MRNKIILILIILIASALRLWKIEIVPISPDWDEAALGYNAYSIMLTGKDEYGEKLPILLQSFDDYKPALYAYLSIPAIKIFGLNTFAVRLPSAIFGILTVLASYFLINELFMKRKVRNWRLDNEEGYKIDDIRESESQKISNQESKITNIALLTSLLLAISPWHIQFSRVAFEANTGLALNIFGLLFFLKGLKNSKYLFLSAVFYALSFYVYQSEKAYVPLIGIVLAYVFRSNLLAAGKKLLAPTVLFIILSVPFFWTTFTTPNALLRAQGVSFFADQTPFLENTARRLIRDRENDDYIGYIFDNRRVTYAKGFIGSYLSHFDLNWLFISGDQPRHHAPNMGLLYLWELPFLLAGIYSLIFGNFPKKTKQLILGWILITPIPASITSGVPHAIRTLNFLPSFQILTATGILYTLKYFNFKISNFKFVISSIFYLLSSTFIIINFIYYLNQYFVQYNYFESEVWQYGYKEAVETVKHIEGDYKKVIVENRPRLDQSYIFFLYYLQYNPIIYLAEGGTGTGGFAEGHKFSKYEFRPIDWKNEEKSSDVLYIGRFDDFPEEINQIRAINFLNGKPAIRIVAGK